LARELLVGLRERGLEVTRPILCVIDGAKALRRAITDVFDHPARCTPATRSGCCHGTWQGDAIQVGSCPWQT
jgi:hypothetical protein